MFDARSLLDMLVRGSAQGQQPSQRAARPNGEPAQQASGSLEDMLRNFLGASEGAPGASTGGLNEMLTRLQQPAGPGAGGLADMVRQVLGQATSGVREGAQHLDQATGASGRARDAIGQATGRSPEELLEQIKALIANNRLGAGVALGGFGAVLLGTGIGRALATSAIKLTGAALIGGLAYKAYQNYRGGRPLITGATPPQALLAAPDGSGFEAGAANDALAALCIRAMIAAAAADGRIDAAERQKILGELKQAGIDGEAGEFIRTELERPATPEELAAGVATPVQALQVYTAARLAVEVDTAAEHDFLQALADAFDIEEELAAHVDEQVRGAAA